MTLSKKIVLLLIIICSQSLIASTYNFTRTAPQRLLVIDDGKEAFYHRYMMIQNATESINIEYFIFNIEDSSTQIIVQELVKKAKAGIRVRILIDNFYYNLSRPLTNRMIQAGIKIKIFNAFFLFSKRGQHRNHRKLFSTDGVKAIIGGRNISNEYFDISEKFNFHDRDLLVSGTSVQTMDQSFERYWRHKFSKITKIKSAPRKPVLSNIKKSSHRKNIYRRWKAQSKEANSILNPHNESLISTRSNLLTEGRNSFLNNHFFDCPDSIFVTDEPGEIGRVNKATAVYLYNRLRSVQSSVLIETPYFVPKKIEYQIFKDLLENSKKVSLITNGINGTDAAIISAMFLKRASFFTKKGMVAYIHPGQNINDPTDPRLWALHNKTFIFDDKDVIIGSYNLDPRSRNLNSEMVFECKNNLPLVASMKAKFAHSASQSIRLNTKGKPRRAEADGFRFKFKKIGSNILLILANHFDFLL